MHTCGCFCLFLFSKCFVIFLLFLFLLKYAYMRLFFCFFLPKCFVIFLFFYVKNDIFVCQKVIFTVVSSATRGYYYRPNCYVVVFFCVSCWYISFLFFCDFVFCYFFCDFFMFCFLSSNLVGAAGHIYIYTYMILWLLRVIICIYLYLDLKKKF